jgi:hypothetical protein
MDAYEVMRLEHRIEHLFTNIIDIIESQKEELSQKLKKNDEKLNLILDILKGHECQLNSIRKCIDLGEYDKVYSQFQTLNNCNFDRLFDLAITVSSENKEIK